MPCTRELISTITNAGIQADRHNCRVRSPLVCWYEQQIPPEIVAIHPVVHFDRDDRGLQRATGEPQLVRVPEGWFTMGSESGRDDEQPAHRVWVDAFQLAAYQVRNCDYAEFLRSTGHAAPPQWTSPEFNHPDQPVVSVSWFDAVAYCEWLSSRTGRKYRLPSEAEWERAARGEVEGAAFPWGDEPAQSRPDYASRWTNGPEPVGRYEPNVFGLFDICENVHEWCSDWYAADYYRTSPDRNPAGPPDGKRRSSRGGSWRHHVKIARCSARSSIPPDFKYADYGFRVAFDAMR